MNKISGTGTEYATYEGETLISHDSKFKITDSFIEYQ